MLIELIGTPIKWVHGQSKEANIILKVEDNRVGVNDYIFNKARMAPLAKLEVVYFK